MWVTDWQTESGEEIDVGGEGKDDDEERVKYNVDDEESKEEDDDVDDNNDVMKLRIQNKVFVVLRKMCSCF